MKPGTNFIDYGIYIDRKHAFIVSLDHLALEKVIAEEIVESESDSSRSTHNDNQEHIQRHRNEVLAKMCKAVMAKLENAHSILIFGPAESKFELQKELRNSRHLKHIQEELLVTDVMDKEAAIRFVTGHYTTIRAGQEVFTAPKK